MRRFGGIFPLHGAVHKKCQQPCICKTPWHFSITTHTARQPIKFFDKKSSHNHTNMQPQNGYGNLLILNEFLRNMVFLLEICYNKFVIILIDSQRPLQPEAGNR